MKNLPITNEVQELMEDDSGHSGVWNVKGKDKYIKIASKLHHHPFKIYYGPLNKHDKKKALNEALMRAKVYKRLAEKGVYPPKTEVVLCEDSNPGSNCLSVLVLLPQLSILDYLDAKPEEREEYRIKMDKHRHGLERRLGFMMSGEFKCNFNWGVDKKTGECYFHDLHLDIPYEKQRELALGRG